MKQKFEASYDPEGDVLTLFRPEAHVKESIEVTEDMVIDLDREKRIVNLELIDAFKFLNTLNKKISKKVLSSVHNVHLDLTNYRNYWIITLVFEHDNEIIEERLPAFSTSAFESPLIAST